MKLLVMTKGGAIYYGTKRGPNGKWFVLDDATWIRKNKKRNIFYSVHWIRKKHIKNMVEMDIDVNGHTHKELEEMLSGQA